MNSKSTLSHYMPLIYTFFLINILCTVLRAFLISKNVDPLVLMGGNTLLFFVSLLVMFLNIKAATNSNPNVFIRSVMGGIFIKLIVVAAAALIYFLKAGENKSVYAVALCMVWYIIYTVIEVKGALAINKKQHGRN